MTTRRLGPNDITVNVLVDILALVSLDAPKSLVAGWGQKTRKEVEAYCLAVHLRASDNIVRVPPKPVVLNNKKIRKIGFIPIRGDQ